VIGLSLAKATKGAVPCSIYFLAANACAELIRPLIATSDEAMAMVNIAAIIVLLVTITINGNPCVFNKYGTIFL
jgi:hypothetical protein